MHGNRGDLKVEFVYDATERIDATYTRDGIQLDSLANIAANKISALFGRKTLKDFENLVKV
jgi:hypothetical protein